MTTIWGLWIAVSDGWRCEVRLYVVGLIAALVVAGLWTVVVPDGKSNAQSGCASQGAVTPSETALASDCEVLLSIRDTLAGTAALNWAADAPIADWDGISVGGTPMSVVRISLVDKRLTGTIPPQLGNLPNLTELDLYDNQLSGEIPSELGNLSNLWLLKLGANELSGEIPTELGNLINLTKLNLESNALSGEIPSELGNLINLIILELGGNELGGEIPTELGNLSNLWLLLLGRNQLSGEIPPELGDLPKLGSLDLDDNRLSGKVPSELGNLSNLSWLHLDGNQLTGEFPASFTRLARMHWLEFFSNAGLCAPVDDAIQAWLKSIDYVRGSSCAPMDSQEDRDMLVQFYKSTNGADWKIQSNWLSNRPIREWHGVANDEKGNVTGIYLRGNQLTGSIPPELGSLSELKDLYLSYNWLTGPIPPELGSLSNLKDLFLHVNQLTGPIPLELINLSNLRSLYLSYNQLTGCIPAPLQHFHDLERLGLSLCVIPGVTMSIDPENEQVRIESTIPVTVRFTEPVNDFVASDVAVANGDVSNFAGSDGDSVYTFDLSPNAVGIVTVDIASDVAGDSDGYANTPAAQLIVGLPYDDDHDGAITYSEILEAVADYFDGRLAAQHILELVSLYFQSTG